MNLEWSFFVKVYIFLRVIQLVCCLWVTDGLRYQVSCALGKAGVAASLASEWPHTFTQAHQMLSFSVCRDLKKVGKHWTEQGMVLHKLQGYSGGLPIWFLKVSSKPSVKAVKSMGLPTLMLVEETGKSCHFTAWWVPFQALYSVSPTHTQKRRHQKQSVRKITSLRLQVAGRFTWPSRFTPAASLTLRLKLSSSWLWKAHSPQLP